MIFLFLIGILFVIEMVVKNRIEKTKILHKKYPILGGKIVINPHHNAGTAGEKFVKKQKTIALVALIITILFTIVFLVTLTKHGYLGLKTGMAILLGGAFSNTYDRLKRKYVVDYITFPIKGKLGQLVFNLSDFMILIGAIMISIFY